jgi:3-methylfumaryl-CoA hydratase
MSDWANWTRRTQEQADVLTPALLRRFRATIDSPETGDIAPQGIHWCLCVPDTPTSALGVDGHPKRGGFLPPIPLPRRMWASSVIDFHAPICAGAAVVRHSVIADVREKAGASGPLVFVDIDHDIVADGTLALHERQTLVYREAAPAAQVPAAPLPAAPALQTADVPDWPHHRSITPSEPMLFRYSALTFNTHRIHYDRPYAVEAEGYPGLVVHGPLSATLLLDFAGRNHGHNRVRRFSFRGQAPAFSGEVMHLVERARDDHLDVSALNAAGDTIMVGEARW